MNTQDSNSQYFTSSNLVQDTETEGFDLQAGQTWIYPTNYPVRNYQYNIVEQALFKNTLVSLPTGLGKTFIAAVVMYNFFRWYPLGKIIFMAPTKPLVKQQIDACYNVTAIPKDMTAELTGTKLSSSRADVWKDKRVFFITPQILQNDLDSVEGLGKKIKCLIFDEAHRARGNHAYCEVIRKLVPQNKYFRVLALSATPGSTVNDVLEVVKNLLISHLEFRTEESLDVHPYVFERNLTTVVVPLGEKLKQIHDDYLQILEYYTRTLIKYNVIQGNCANLTKGKIFITLKEFQQKSRGAGIPNYGEIMKSLNICVTLYHGFELLVRHGLRSFLTFFDEHMEKPLLKGNTHLLEILNDIREYLGPEPVIEQLPDGSFTEIRSTSKFGHPKFYKLQDILVSHFTKENDSSRVIVFFEYRNSVLEAYALLNQARPLLKPRIFLGQTRGITQRQQINVIKSFREGQCNILLSTCIGEEGLDVGDVDLIVCFDISTKSPIRMIQRMGRTGRKKQGQIVVLVTEGKEQQILKDCLIHKKNIVAHVLSSKELIRSLNAYSPRLVPSRIVPKCDKIFITVQKATVPKKNTLKDMFRNISSNSSSHTSCDLTISDVSNRIPVPENLWNKKNPLDENLLISNMFSKRLEKQRVFQTTHCIKHSPYSELLVNLLKYVDSKRFNILVTQKDGSQNMNLKQCDIRHMFSKSQQSAFMPETQSQKIPPLEIDSMEDDLRNSKVFSEISMYVSIRILIGKKCKHCFDNFDCDDFVISQNKQITWTQQDDFLFNTITVEDLEKFSETHLGSKLNEDEGNMHDNSYTYLKSQTDAFDPKTIIEGQIPNHSLLNKLSPVYENTDTQKYLLDFFKLKSLEDLFKSVANTCNGDETIIYSQDQIDSLIEKENSDELHNQKQQNCLSPVISTNKLRKIKNIRKSQISKNLEEEYKQSSVNASTIQVNSQPELRKISLDTSLELSFLDKNSNASNLTENNVSVSSTPLYSKISNKHNLSNLITEFECNSHSSYTEKESDDICDIDDICDLSVFGLSTTNKLPRVDSKKTNSLTENNLDISDLCDLSIFGAKTVDEKILKENVTQNVCKSTKRNSLKSTEEEKSIGITQIINMINGDEKESNFNNNKTDDQLMLPPKQVDRKLFKNTHSSTKIKNIDNSKKLRRHKSVKTKHANPFIEDEAELSIENISISDDEDEQDETFYEASFINDNTQDIDTQSHIGYLQSIRNTTNRGTFKIPWRSKETINKSTVCSQETFTENDTYLNDSFVVCDDEIIDEQCGELSQLEILEQKLQQQKNKDRCNDANPPKRRKRIRLLSDDDSD